MSVMLWKMAVRQHARLVGARSEIEKQIATLEVRQGELQDQLQRLASELQGKQAETERIPAEIQSYAQVLHAQSVDGGAFFYRTGQPTFEANCLATAGLQCSKSKTFAAIKSSNFVKFEAV